VYQYQPQDRQLVHDRVRQFKDQTERYLSGQLTEEAFRPLRLQNGLYLQRQAPMLRIAVPYGLLNTKQLRQLASIVGVTTENMPTSVHAKISNSTGQHSSLCQRS